MSSENDFWTEEELDREIKRLKKQRKKLRKNSLWHCPNCLEASPIKDLIIEIYKFYVRPTGCMEGDYWTIGNHPTYHIICPNCEKEIKIYSYVNKWTKGKYLNKEQLKLQTEWDFVNKYKNYFKEIVITAME